MDFVWMVVMTAQIEEIKEQNQSASATQWGFRSFVHVIVAIVAPAQKVACRPGLVWSSWQGEARPLQDI
jgi:hypothetical protein